MVRGLIVMMLVLLMTSSVFALSTQQAQRVGVEVINTPYRYMDVINEDITGEDDGTNAETVTFRISCDFILIAWDDASNELHVQCITADGDTNYVRKEDVIHVQPDEAVPIYVKDITGLKLNLPYDADSGSARIWGYKI